MAYRARSELSVRREFSSNRRFRAHEQVFRVIFSGLLCEAERPGQHSLAFDKNQFVVCGALVIVDEIRNTVAPRESRRGLLFGLIAWPKVPSPFDSSV